MRILTVLRRRVGAHPVALVAIALSVLTSMLVVASLQLIIGRISGQGVDQVLAADVAQRSVAVRGTVALDEIQAADDAVRQGLLRLGPGTTVSRVVSTTVRGIEGRGESDRAQVAEAEISTAAELVTGAWPQRAGEVVVPEGTATELDLAPGDRLRLVDLVRDGPPLQVTVTGFFRVDDPDAPVWADLPLATRGVDEGTDFRTLGPFVLAEGTLGSGSESVSVAWRGTPDLTAVSPRDLDDRARVVEDVVTSLARTVGAAVGGVPQDADDPVLDGNAVVETSLGSLLEDAADLTSRIRATLLTPTVLLALLAAVALAVSGGLLASLRESDTRMLRTRGASRRQLALLSGVEATTIAVGSALLALLLAPLVVRAVGDTPRGLTEGLFSGRAVVALGLMVLLAVVVIVGTTMRLARESDLDRGGRRGGAWLRLLAGSGVDLVVVAVGALAVLQLRRYADADRSTIDPLTTLAPALVIAGLSLLALRLLPVLTHRVAAVTSGHPRLPVAWGGWQLARRLAAQGGTILLVLLAVAMGDLALAHGSTSQRMFVDQERARVGAPVRVDQDFVRAQFPGSIHAAAAGGADRVTPVLRTSVDIGSASGVDVLALDAATADTVITPRPDTLDGQDWSALMAGLVDRRDPVAGVPVPGTPETLSVDVRIAGVTTGQLDALGATDGGLPVELLVRDARGLVSALDLGEIGVRERSVELSLSEGPQWPLAVVGVVAQTSLEAGVAPPSGIDPRIVLSGLRADGKPVPGLAALSESGGIDPIVLSAPAGRTNPGAVITDAVAEAARLEPGGTFRVGLPGRQVEFEVTAVVKSVPTARSPYKAVVIDLPAVQASAEPQGEATTLSAAELTPREWWLDPEQPTKAVADLRADPRLVGEVHSLDEAIAARADDPVNVGMKASMWLVTLAALALAALGFAAATFALRRTRLRDNVVLLSLGMPWSSVRAVLMWERVLVVAMAAAVGSVIGWLTSLVVVPVLVGGDGVAAVPPVRLDLPVLEFAGLAIGVVLLLSLVALGVLRRHAPDLAAELRRMEA